MEQKEVIRLLVTMINGADQLVEAARNRNTEANDPKSDNYIIRDCIYANLQYFNGYKQGISNVLANLRKYYFTEAAKKEAKTASASLYGNTVYTDTDSLKVEVE